MRPPGCGRRGIVTIGLASKRENSHFRASGCTTTTDATQYPRRCLASGGILCRRMDRFRAVCRLWNLAEMSLQDTAPESTCENGERQGGEVFR